MKSIALVEFSTLSGSIVTGGPTKATFILGFESFIISAIFTSTWKARRGGEQHQQLEILRLRDRFLDRNAVRRRIRTLLPSIIPAG